MLLRERVAGPRPEARAAPTPPPHTGTVAWLSPWPLFRAHARSVAVALTSFIVVLLIGVTIMIYPLLSVLSR